MTEPDLARVRNRYFLIAFSRLAGVVIALAGLVVIGGKRPSIPVPVGYLLVVIGMLAIAFGPRVLARRWRTPPTE